MRRVELPDNPVLEECNLAVLLLKSVVESWDRVRCFLESDAPDIADNESPSWLIIL